MKICKGMIVLETTRTCKQCQKEFPLSRENFYKRKDGYYDTICIECRKHVEHNRREQRKEYMQSYLRNYYVQNKDAINASNRAYYQKHRCEMRKQQAEYRESNKKSIDKKHAEYIEKRRNNDPIYKLKAQARSNIYGAFKRGGFSKSKKANEITGLSSSELCKHLLMTFENRYKREWDGTEKVHIDHIIPLAAATTKSEIEKLCHYSNLQLLTESDNIAKSNKIIEMEEVL